MLKFINFDKSKIGWVLKNGSIGQFNVDAILKNKKNKNCYYLASTVIGGNVYGKKNLPIKPNFHYQWITDKKNTIVYKIYKNGKTLTFKNLSKNLKEITTNIKLKQYKKITDFELLNNDNISKKLICTLELKDQILVFPVKHINIQIKMKKFQVETGPIIFKKKENIIPGFIFFNCLNFSQIIPRYPALDKGVIKQKNKINFYV